MNKFLDNGMVPSPIQRLEKVEKAAEKFVAGKLQEVGWILETKHLWGLLLICIQRATNVYLIGPSD